MSHAGPVRLNCRTVYMNPVHRFLYWNMNYHVEHHMYPLVPYHALPRGHETVKDDCPTPYRSLLAWGEIIPAVFRQVKDPAYHFRRTLPPLRQRLQDHTVRADTQADAEGWIDIRKATDLAPADIPGEYLPLDIPAYDAIHFTQFDIPETKNKSLEDIEEYWRTGFYPSPRIPVAASDRLT